MSQISNHKLLRDLDGHEQGEVVGMGVAAPSPSSQHLLPHHLINHRYHMMAWRSLTGADPGSSSVSQGFHQGGLGFSHGFGRSAPALDPRQRQQYHIAQQNRRGKLRVQGADSTATGTTLMPTEEGEEPIYEPGGTCNMLSDMFDFPAGRGPSACDLIANQMPGDWYGSNRQEADPAAAMQLFLTNTVQLQLPRSPSLPSSPPPSLQQPYGSFQSPSFGDGSFGGEVVLEGQGLSLSLSTSLHQLEMAKAQDLKQTEGFLGYGSQHHHHQQQQPWQLPGQLGQVISHGEQVHHVGYGSSIGVANVPRRSKYSSAARELLDEFCSVARDQVKRGKKGKHHGSSADPNPSSSSAPGASSSTAGSPSSTKAPTLLSPAERFEHQRRKARLRSMLEEVGRRYNLYCDKMQTVVNSLDSAMGFGAAASYTSLAQKAMSRHFRCLKDAITSQLKQTCQLLGEKDGRSPSGLTKGETPRLRLLEQTIRQQRAFHEMGMVEQEAWRPQRGLPERSVNILRAWLFEHFLQPYPTDADKHLLARQTGLSRNQVSNWFINARVRLWKPMVEEMYQQEAKEAAEAGESGDGRAQSSTQHQPLQLQHQQHRQLQKAETHAAESNPSRAPPSSAVRIMQQQQLTNQQRLAATEAAPTATSGGASSGSNSGDVAALVGMEVLSKSEPWGPERHVVPRGGIMNDYYTTAAAMAVATVVTFGSAGTSGDVSLTLGLSHAGNTPETGRFTIRDFADF